MKLDKPAFLALVTLISGATAACNAPVDDAGEQSGASSAASCVKPSDAPTYPVQEGCYQTRDSSACMVWSDHLYVGVAKAAMEATFQSGDSIDEITFATLTNVCNGSTTSEKALGKTCGEIADLQLAASDHSMNIREADYRWRGSSDKAELVTACKDMLRGMKAESRPIIKRCIQKNPSFPVYSCIEGVFWRPSSQVCSDTNGAVGSERFDGCDATVANECSNVDAMFKAKPASDTKACIVETQIIMMEEGPGVTPAQLREVAADCGVSVLSSACRDADGASKTSCASMVAELKAADPHLSDKGHINAGGVFTKKCEQAVSGMTPAGVQAMAACIEGAARQVKAGTKEMGSVSVRACLSAMIGSKG